MKKLILMIISFNFLLAECGVFTNVLQTRKDPSSIDVNSNSVAYIYDSPGCVLNTGSVYRDGDYGLKCKDGFATASGIYAKSLDINYSFTLLTPNVSEYPGGGDSYEITEDNETLNNDKYNNITQNDNHYNFTWAPSGDDIGVNKFDKMLNTVTIDNIENKDLKIGKFITDSNDRTTLNLKQIPNNIKIYKIESTGSNVLSFLTAGNEGMEAKDNIEIDTFLLDSNAETNITLKAPKIIIRKLDLTGGNNHITIYADEIDIDEIDFGEQSTLNIHPYTPGKKVKFYNRQTNISSSSQMIWDSGDYYIKDIDIPISGSGKSFVNASSENEIINLYLDPLSQNHDFEVGKNFGINSEGSGGQFGNNPPANFRIFVNGDFEVGDADSANDGTTVNALIYLEGETNLGKYTYVRGAISSYKTITIGNESQFYWDKSIESLPESQACLAQVVSSEKDNYYVCGLFKGPLITYDTIQGNGTKPKVCGSENLFAVKVNNIDYIKCSLSQSCDNATNCNVKNPPDNRYNPNLLESNQTTPIPENLYFTETDYENYDFDSPNLVLNFYPRTRYSDSDTNYSTFGSWTFKENNITLNFKPGDYYFDDLTFNGDNIHINILDGGPVRIFVKENLKFDKNNVYINDNGDENNLFIYVGGNMEFKDTENTPLHIYAFSYVKGNVEFKSSSDDFYWYGGITAEGDITIDSDYAHFIYRGTNDKLGYGDCPLCYADQINGHWISIMDFLKMTFKMPKRSAIINESNQTLKDLNVTLKETDPSWFTGTTPQLYRLIDENNNTVFKDLENNTTYQYHNDLLDTTISLPPIIKKGKGVVTAPPRGDIQPPVGASDIQTISETTAYLGEYNATGFEHYNALETTFGIDTTIHGSNLNNFFADYIDEYGRYYKNIKLDYCGNVPATSLSNPSDTIALIDAWDADENITHRVIKTKIVNKEFNLTIAGIENNQETSLNKGNVKFALYDVFNQTEITPFYDFNTSNASIEHKFNISKSVKDVKVEFKICADVDSNGSLIIKDSSQCSNAVYQCRENPGTVAWRKCFSSDDFAIRPYKFVIQNAPTVVKAGEEFNITVKALDYQNNPAQNYNEIVSVVNSPRIKYIDNDANATKLIDITSTNRKFSNGVVTLTLRYPDVGEGNITIDEVNGSEFALVDANDTNVSARFIQSARRSIKFIPFAFRIDAKYSNFNNSSFTYLSNDLNMSSNLDINITAINKDGNVTEYYNNTMYAKNITLTITHSVPSNINSVRYMETSQNIIQNTNINNPIQLSLNKNYFTTSHKGEAYIHIKINFPRNSRKPVNNFNFTINDINVTDNDANGSQTLNQSAQFYYGRIFIDNVAGYNSTLSDTAKYQYWNNNDWVLNTNHINNSFGEIKSLYINSSDVNYSKDSLSNGLQKVTLSTTHALPYKVKVHVAVPSWLWYHPLAKNYQDPSASNQDCLTHPCFNAFFEKDSKGWGGVGINTKKYKETNRTSEMNSSLDKINVNKKSVKKLNW